MAATHRIPLLSVRKKKKFSPVGGSNTIPTRTSAKKILTSPLTSVRGFPNLRPIDYVNIIDKYTEHSQAEHYHKKKSPNKQKEPSADIWEALKHGERSRQKQFRDFVSKVNHRKLKKISVMMKNENEGSQKAGQEIINAMVDYRKRPVGSSTASYEASEPEDRPGHGAAGEPLDIHDLPEVDQNSLEIENTIQFTNEQTI